MYQKKNIVLRDYYRGMAIVEYKLRLENLEDIFILSHFI